jgi:hypothetical protein
LYAKNPPIATKATKAMTPIAIPASLPRWSSLCCFSSASGSCEVVEVGVSVDAVVCVGVVDAVVAGFADAVVDASVDAVVDAVAVVVVVVVGSGFTTINR